jgi:uncharacterized beta-barrel protein YwiB (DUF1934 family)
MEPEVRTVTVQLTSSINGEQQSYAYAGEYRKTDSGHNIVYTDYAGNAVTKVGIEATESAMLLHRVGAITADMCFDSAADTFVAYDALTLRHGFTLHTYDYQVEEQDNGISIFVEYGLDDGSGHPEIRGSQEIELILEEETR